METYIIYDIEKRVERTKSSLTVIGRISPGQDNHWCIIWTSLKENSCHSRNRNPVIHFKWTSTESNEPAFADKLGCMRPVNRIATKDFGILDIILDQ